jgi:hypothetical protein
MPRNHAHIVQLVWPQVEPQTPVSLGYCRADIQKVGKWILDPFPCKVDQDRHQDHRYENGKNKEFETRFVNGGIQFPEWYFNDQRSEESIAWFVCMA